MKRQTQLLFDVVRFPTGMHADEPFAVWSPCWFNEVVICLHGRSPLYLEFTVSAVRFTNSSVTLIKLSWKSTFTTCWVNSRLVVFSPMDVCMFEAQPLFSTQCWGITHKKKSLNATILTTFISKMTGALLLFLLKRPLSLWY